MIPDAAADMEPARDCALLTFSPSSVQTGACFAFLLRARSRLDARPLDDIFDIQESVARIVSTQLQGQLSAQEGETLAERPIPNPLAYALYDLRARGEIWRFTAEGLRAALPLLERGAEIVGENPVLLYSMACVEWQYFDAGIAAPFVRTGPAPIPPRCRTTSRDSS